MVVPPIYSAPDTRMRLDRGSTTGMPEWVKVFGIVALVVVLTVVVMMLTGRGGSHGPGRHAPSGGAPPSGISGHGA